LNGFVASRDLAAPCPSQTLSPLRPSQTLCNVFRPFAGIGLGFTFGVVGDQ